MSKQNGEYKEGLERGLSERHIQLIALGGAIGVGLFLGSSKAINTAGPALLLAYAFGGIMMYVIMRALGELAVSHPISGSFAAYANKFIGPLSGYLTGWTYWFMWIITCMAEITAVGVYMKFWFPDLPQWLPALAALAIMTAVNMVAVKFYGEFEFWFALIKVVTIIAMLVIGTLMIVFGIFHGGQPIGFSNLWSHGGFFAKGITGPIMAMVMVSFAYLGIELIGVTAGEAQNPEIVIPSAIDKVLWRILVFYIGALTVIMSIFPWTEIGTSGSPFVLVFSGIGIKSAAGIINFVVLTAAMSSCNSGIFSTGRMLYNLSQQGEAPKSFVKLSSQQVPTNAIRVSAAVMLVGVLLNYVLPEKVFTYLTSIATFAAIWTWAVIIISQMNFRKSLSIDQIKKLKYPMFAFPIANYIALIFLFFVIIIMWFDPDTRIALFVGPIWLAILTVIYYAAGINKVVIDESIKTTDLEDVN